MTITSLEPDRRTARRVALAAAVVLERYLRPSPADEIHAAEHTPALVAAVAVAG